MESSDDEASKAIQKIHSEVMMSFMKDCSNLDFNDIGSCVASKLRENGLEVLDIRMFDLDGRETNDPSTVKYVRASVKGDLPNIEHIFTFAVIKRRDKFNVLFMQSAVNYK
ncbi:MAG: hypothetical protein RXO22_00725 [Thermocladium sp.]|jgi:hypothetical protein|nr:MAG: hypothetical protein AT710_02980 [Thermocladium sp. ECH_B]